MAVDWLFPACEPLIVRWSLPRALGGVARATAIALVLALLGRRWGTSPIVVAGVAGYWLAPALWALGQALRGSARYVLDHEGLRLGHQATPALRWRDLTASRRQRNRRRNPLDALLLEWQPVHDGAPVGRRATLDCSRLTCRAEDLAAFIARYTSPGVAARLVPPSPRSPVTRPSRFEP